MTSALQGQHLHFDCVSGIAGDMSIGALIDLGVPAAVIHEAIEAVGLGSERLQLESVNKAGIAATNATVRCDEVGDQLGAKHEHEHAHYHYSSIREQIESSSLSAAVKSLSLRIFDRLAEAEAKLHGTSVEDVAFHEVGAVDSIVDVIGAAAAIDWLAPASVSASPVAMGKGTIRCAHGILPVPSPAALEILRAVQAPIRDGGLAKELCTPTGAAILAATVTHWDSMPEMIPTAIGYGAGDIDLPDRPNVLRAVLGRVGAMPSSQTVIEIETNIDDMSPELCEHVGQALFASGALDVWWTPIQMKKGRPAWTLRALAEVGATSLLVDVILRESTAIGVRFQRKQRAVLERELVEVQTPYGAIPMKIARRGGQVFNAAPEYEACRRRAELEGVALKDVFAAAHAAWLARS